MNYHIGTLLIKKHFNSDCECPLCEIFEVIESRLVKQFLADAVMEEETRKNVNKLGFCKHHFEKLFLGDSKLGLGLQIDTILAKQLKDNPFPKNYKHVKSYLKNTVDMNKTCIICKFIDENMTRYYKTIAQIYSNENNFKETLDNTKGFCQMHYRKLLEYANYAGSKKDEYVLTLSELQNKTLLSLKAELNEYIDHHDYRKINTPLGESKTSLKRMGNKIYGKTDL